jgi:pseudouridine-5'-phosphate glycosidase
LQIHEEVAAAFHHHTPVVALESTVITHGLPYPENIATAQQMEMAVRQGGAIPATIAILKGCIHIGLSQEQIEYLGQRPQTTIRKCSRRDLPIAIGQQLDGSTTVAGTMILAHLAGIAVFATGGIGGVHRGHPFDVSADLLELGRTPMTVVCSGAKSILDLPLTLEVLETQGVPVIGYQTDELPAFYARHTGLPLNCRVDSVTEAAVIIRARDQLGLKTGTLITVPVPVEAALDADTVEAAVAQATQEANRAGISGATATPWLLSRVSELTEGRSRKANQALLTHNGLVAAQIAVALAG